MAKPADVTHSSLWGGDLQAFILQAGAARPLQAHAGRARRPPTTCCPASATRCPTASILGARGAYGLMSPKSALNDWWWDLYSKAYNAYPVQAPYRMAQSLLGLKLAVEKAMAANGGKKPTARAARRGADATSSGIRPAGRIRMALGDGHQAIQDTAIGKTRYDAAKKMVVLDDIQRFPADCVNPPAEHEVGGLDQGRLPGRARAARDARARAAAVTRRRSPILIDGLTYASWLFIVALGLTLVFGVLKILNIAHGSFYALGAYAAASFVGWVATLKWAPALSHRRDAARRGRGRRGGRRR